MAPRIRKNSKVHTIRKVTDQDLFPKSPVNHHMFVPKNENGIVQSVADSIATVVFDDIDVDWLINLELLKVGWYDKKSK